MIDNLYENQKYQKQLNQKKLQELKHERDQWPLRAHEQKWSNVLKELPSFPKADYKNYDNAMIELGQRDELNSQQVSSLEQLAQKLIPWKKGPFKLFEMEIDGEWRSDFKWERIVENIEHLEGRKVLDIGCNNGYFMFRMLAQNPSFVLGIDPVVRTWAQFHFLQYFAQDPRLQYELFGVEHVPYFHQFFDTIFSMGILYHHRHPLQQLIDMREALVPGGELVLETIAINGDDSVALFPEGRYAHMPNVWFVPTETCLINWLKRCRFEKIEVLHNVPTTPQEQRWTPWCPEGAQSYEDFLDPEDETKTEEGYPAPRRLCIKAKKKGTK